MDPGPDPTSDHVAIVGAGFAGLTAARKLAAAGKEVCVLEARDRVGGRTLNHDIGDGKVVEVGGPWIGPTQHRLVELAKELGVDTFPTFSEGRSSIEWQGQIKRYTGLIPRLNPAILLGSGGGAAFFLFSAVCLHFIR